MHSLHGLRNTSDASSKTPSQQSYLSRLYDSVDARYLQIFRSQNESNGPNYVYTHIYTQNYDSRSNQQVCVKPDRCMAASSSCSTNIKLRKHKGQELFKDAGLNILINPEEI